jgi:hypothetical protein
MRRALLCLQTIAFCAALLMVVGICLSNLQAQDARPIPAPSVAPRGIPQDWSNRHVVYTRNGSFEDMVKVRDDPRFINSVRSYTMREHPNQTKQAGATDLFKKKNSKVDWSVSLGHFAGMAIGETPAKYTFNPIAPPSCSDFVVFTINVPSGNVAAASQGNLVGITNLYSGSTGDLCGTRPTFLFSYAIGSAGSGLSPVLSLDGSKVAWVETPLRGKAILHVTTWVAGQGSNATVESVKVGTGGSSDVALDYTTSASNPNCTTTSSTNTNSDLYVDYPNDAAYIGADNGILYHISGMFLGTPTVDFCIATGSFTGRLGAAVYDAASSGEVFISDPSTLYAYTVGSSSFTSAGSYQYGASGSTVTSGPLLDSFNGFVYMFSAEDAELPTPHTSVTQLPTSMASNQVVPLGPATTSASAYPVLFNGDFDNNYLTNGPAVAGSTLYTCGTDSTNTAAQDLFAIGFHVTTGVAEFNPVMSANTSVNPGGGNGICSPITEFYDGTTDRIFVGMGDVGATDGANVVTMWDVTTQLTDGVPMPLSAVAAASGGVAVYTGTITGGGANAFAGLQFVVTGFTGAAAVDNGTYICTASTATTLTLANANAVAVTAAGTAMAQPTPTASSGANYFGGTTGFAIDNNAIGTAQAESIYFSTLAPIPTGDTFRCFANHFCAVKLTQSGLQ